MVILKNNHCNLLTCFRQLVNFRWLPFPNSSPYIREMVYLFGNRRENFCYKVKEKDDFFWFLCYRQSNRKSFLNLDFFRGFVGGTPRRLRECICGSWDSLKYPQVMKQPHTSSKGQEAVEWEVSCLDRAFSSEMGIWNKCLISSFG